MFFTNKNLPAVRFRILNGGIPNARYNLSVGKIKKPAKNYTLSYFNVVRLVLMFFFASTFFVSASVIAQSFTQNTSLVNSGNTFLKYENFSQKNIATKLEFESETLSSDQFIPTQTDLTVYTDTTDFLRLNSYRETVPNTQTNDWWDDDNNTATNYNWKFRKCFAVNYIGNQALTDYQLYLDLDTQQAVSEGKMLANGNDIRFLDANLNILDYYIADDMNTTSTRIWLKTETIQANSSQEICMYYGNPLATSFSNKVNVFSYSEPQPIYFNISDKTQNQPMQLVSYGSNNNITFKTNELNLTLGESTTINNINNFNPTTAIKSKGAVVSNFTGDGTDTTVPVSLAGTKFTYPMLRYFNNFYVTSPFCNANVNVFNESGNHIAGSPFAINKGLGIEINTTDNVSNGIPNNSSVILEEINNDCPILVKHVGVHSTTNALVDNFVFFPADYEWIGIGSNSYLVSALQDSTIIEILRSDGVNSDFDCTNGFQMGPIVTLNRGDQCILSGTGVQGTAPSFYTKVLSGGPIGVKSLGDADGVESVTHFPISELDYKYYIPQNAEYVAIATLPEKTTNISYYSDQDECGDGSPDMGSFIVNPSGVNPGKLLINSSTISAGSCFTSDQPFYLYYEEIINNDEKNVFGLKHNRQKVHPEPSYNLGLIEEGLWNFGSANNWSKRIPIELINNSSSIISEYQINLDLSSFPNSFFINTNVDGSDILISNQNATSLFEYDFWVESFSNIEEKGNIWIKTDEIDALSSKTVYLYYDSDLISSTLGNQENVFSTNSLYTTAYMVEKITNDKFLEVISYINNNEIEIEKTIYYLHKGDYSKIPSDDYIVTVGSTAPVHIDFLIDETDTVAPISYAGKNFTFGAYRSIDNFSFYAPFLNATIEIFQSSTSGWNLLNTLSINKDELKHLNLDIVNGRAFKIVASEPILAFHRNESYDTKILYPIEKALEQDTSIFNTQYELYGIGSGSAIITAFDSGTTNVQIFQSNGTTSSIQLNQSNNFYNLISGNGEQGNANAFHLIADKPIGAISLGDADGGESTVFLPKKEFSDEYYLAQSSQYFAIATADPNVTCRVYNESGVEIVSGPSTMNNIPPKTSGSLSMPFPNRIHIGGADVSDGTFFNAGYKLECSEPVFAYYEKGNQDETNFLSWPQARKNSLVLPELANINESLEQGLYFESGFDDTKPKAFIDIIVDSTTEQFSEHTYWESINWNETQNSRSEQNSVEQIIPQVAWGNTTSDCQNATYSNFVNLTNDIVSSTLDNSIPYVTYTNLEKQAFLPDFLSDSQCLKIRYILQTGDTAYSPNISNIQINYSVPTLLEDIYNSQTIFINGEFGSSPSRQRVLKAIAENSNFAGSYAELQFFSVTDPTVFNTANFSFLEVDSGTISPQFNFPPFPNQNQFSGSKVNYDTNNQIAVYLEHNRELGNAEEISLNFNIFLNGLNGPIIQREMQMQFSGN